MVGGPLDGVHQAGLEAVARKAVVAEGRALEDADRLDLRLLLLHQARDEGERLEGVGVARRLLVEGLHATVGQSMSDRESERALALTYIEHVLAATIGPTVHGFLHDLDGALAKVLVEQAQEGALAGSDVALDAEHDRVLERRQAGERLGHEVGGVGRLRGGGVGFE